MRLTLGPGLTFQQAMEQFSQSAVTLPGVGVLQGGGVLEVPYGEHYVDSATPVHVPDFVTIAGEGPGSLLLFPQGGGLRAPYQVNAATNTAVNYGGRVCIRDLGLYQVGGNLPSVGLDMVGGAGVTVERVSFGGWSVQMALDDVNMARVSECTFGSTSAGVASADAIGVWLVGENRDGRITQGECNLNWFDRCQFNGPRIPVWSQSGLQNKFTGCNFNNPGHVRITGGKRLKFDSCNWETPTDDAAVMIEGAGLAAIGLGFNGCTFASNSGKYAVWLHPDATVQGFAFDDCFIMSGRGVHLQAVNVTGPVTMIGSRHYGIGPMVEGQPVAEQVVLFASQDLSGQSARSVGIGTVHPEAVLDIRGNDNSEYGLIIRSNDIVRSSVRLPP